MHACYHSPLVMSTYACYDYLQILLTEQAEADKRG
jgi:hypothetical protein